MPSHSITIPDCQPPATNAEGVMAVTPNAGGGVGPYILFADCDGNRLAVGDTVEVLTLPGTRLVIAELLLSPISVVVDGKITFPVCEFVYVDQGGSLTVFYASKVKKITPVSLTERQRMSAAAAHAYEMQTGGTHD